MKNTKYFKPKAHILRLLGNELIKNPIMAIYELVKNSYDADSKSVNVDFKNIENIDELNNARNTIKNIEAIEQTTINAENIDEIEELIENIQNTIENIEEVKNAINTIKTLKEPTITIEDNGTGLTSDTIENVWLEPGTDHRKPIDKRGNRIINRSPIFGRVPMGEKGVGRFAVHKLGDRIKLITRPEKIEINKDGEIENRTLLDYEIVLEIDWNVFSQKQYLEEIPVSWVKELNQDKFHFKKSSGTKIEISHLKEPWTKRMGRDLKRNTLAMLSPKNNSKKFNIHLNFENDWLKDFPDAKKILDIAPYKYEAWLDKNYNITINYDFKLSLNDEFGYREIINSKDNIKGRLIPAIREELEEENLTEEEIKEKIKLFESQENPFGDILLEIYSFDLDPETLRNYTFDAKTLKDILKYQSGIKVFKDQMRVYDYGERGNDWLELDIRRVQNKDWFSNNQNIGFIYLDAEQSTSLVEKTSREGFIDNESFKIFYKCIIEILTDFKAERLKDRNKWLSYLHSAKGFSTEEDKLSLFNKLIDSTNFSEEKQKEKLKKEAEKLQKDYEEKKETMLIPAGVGMTASVALHEMDKLVPLMEEVIKDNPFKKDLALEKIDELKDYLDGVLSVLRKGGNKPIDLNESLKKAISNYRSKLKRRNILIAEEFNESIKTIKCDKRYFITMMMNMIDNSIYWLDTIYKDDKSIFIKTFLDENKNVSIVIADNGPGFKDEITDIVRPFFTRKDDGIGIGLYLVDTIMMKYGKLEIVNSEDEIKEIEIPSKYTGAILKLSFTRNQ